MARTLSGPSFTVSSKAGLTDRDREVCRAVGITRDVVEAFVDDDFGDTMDKVDAVDAFEMLRPLFGRLRGPAGLEGGEILRLRNRDLLDDEPALDPGLVSMARPERINLNQCPPGLQPTETRISRLKVHIN